MKIKLLFFLTIITAFCSINSFSQNNKVVRLENLTSDEPAEITPEGDTLYNIKYRFHLLDSINVNKIHVKIGTTFKGGDIYEGDYMFYENTQNDSVFSRDGLIVSGSAGIHHMGIYFYEIIAEDFQGVKYTAYIRQQ